MANIEKRSERSWRLTVDGGFDTNGKRVLHRKTIRIEDESILRSKRRLQEYLQHEYLRFRQEIETGLYTKPERITFAEFVDTWKVNYADLHLGAYTRRHYLNMLRTHVIPVFGSMELHKIKTMHIVSFLTRLRSPEGRKDGKDKPLAANSQLNIYKALKSVLDAAERWRIIADNPIKGVKRPAPDKAERKALRERKKSYTKAEVEVLIEKLLNEPPHWRLYYLGVVLGGFRRGEMLGMEWHQVDFERGGLNVEKQISLDEQGRPVEADLKTEESRGFVPMPRWYMTELSKYRQTWIRERWHLQQCGKWQGGKKEYLFHNGFGEKLYPSTPSLHWRRLLDKYELPRIRLHDLRHTTATILREDGADLKSIQERLRHTRLSITADLYTHETETVSRETADRLEKLNPFSSRSKSS
ncbi:tyrosine-type recombinase/integrase [Alicyclobacillus vulcanalis]|uniref:Integrase n=1 Tax=Alicyclobacillus vulcanalis TaxID=252246 RepID=A0A1N7MST3_9BACL|nr:tyrosine-type recombinase/integrase [Alicyclobacillus vulcanalis]SIS89207.1 integrase [Alicyclobacillus vulcanalis]